MDYPIVIQPALPVRYVPHESTDPTPPQGVRARMRFARSAREFRLAAAEAGSASSLAFFVETRQCLDRRTRCRRVVRHRVVLDTRSGGDRRRANRRLSDERTAIALRV
ncbi:MAG: hypothetical protein M0037_08810 [Betaproteobacteria bacterium]|nr:hypothetical protein [Betaproteobacteria bacterium]